MKVVAVMEVSPQDGGGFYQALNAVLQMQRLCEGRHAFQVAATNAASLPLLAEFGVAAFHLPTTLLERLQPWLPGGYILHRLLRRITDPVGLERRLLAEGADLAYFVAPWGRMRRFSRLSYWLTVWDLGHLDHPEFPEVFAHFHARERILNAALGAASLTVADSPTLVNQLSHRYGLTGDRIVPMPFAPAKNLNAANCRSRDEVLNAYGLTSGYLFYPAQFWAHKNHVRILEALHACRERGHLLQAVFAGGDFGVRQHVESTAHVLGVAKQVHFLGFVQPGDMRGLYEGAHALVMPTYFGPTNLPPLEAWSLGVPVVYSSHLAEQAGDAALLADPDNGHELADRIIESLDPELRQSLIHRGRLRLSVIHEQREQAESRLLDELQRLAARLRCSQASATSPHSTVGSRRPDNRSA